MKGIKHQPAILQNESHPHLQEKDLRDFCRINKIVFQVRTRYRYYVVLVTNVIVISVNFLNNMFYVIGL